MAEHTMTRRGFLTGAAGAATAALLDPTGRWLAAGAEAAAGPSHNPAEKPNILLIMADDLGYECLGCNGGTSYRTPNLDKLAATGVRFEHCYCTPLCSPSRNQIMTGRYGFRNYRGWGILDPKEKTFGHVLRSAGYATAVSGKWQLCRFDRPENADHPKRAGFDASCVWTWHYKGKKPSRYWDPFIWQDGKLRGDLAGKYGPDVHCDYVVDFIRRNRARPFLAYYPLNLVHAPFVATPDSKASRSAGGGSQPGKGRKGAKQANYAATVAYMDKCIGRVVGELDRLNLREKTLILFTGDNGTPRGITSRMGQSTIAGGKGRMTDAGTHVPLIANWPGHAPAGKVCGELVDFSDFLPTLADASRTPLPEGVTIDGRSFLPQLLGRAGTPREWVYIHFRGGTGAKPGKLQRALRTERWKLYGDGRLFDMKADPSEKRPLQAGAEPAEASAARKRLQAVLAKLA